MLKRRVLQFKGNFGYGFVLFHQLLPGSFQAEISQPGSLP
jgi:hypothetical protein